MRQQRQFRKQCVSVFGWLEWNFTEGEFPNPQSTGGNVYKEVAIMWKNKESSSGLTHPTILREVMLK